jgi:hypothetical protein
MSDFNSIRNEAMQEFRMFAGYRVYLTREAWIITYQDIDLVRVMRGTEHQPGFLLLLVELVFMLLIGKRSDLRERWALYHDQYQQDAKMCDLSMRATRNGVAEFVFSKTASKLLVKESDD